MADAAAEVVTIRYRDAWGCLQEIRVSRAQARTIRAIRQAARRADRKWEERHATFTDAGIAPGSVAAREGAARRASEGGYPWEGAKIGFPLLLGNSPTWSGAESLWLESEDGLACRFCGHYRRRPPASAYCLGCDRSGRDDEIGVPSRADLDRRRPESRPEDGLEGGRGPRKKRRA